MRGLILLNGKIYAGGAKKRVFEALAASNSKIIALGRNQDIKNLINKDIEVYDLKEKTVFPGFTDCHTHFRYFASTFDNLDLSKANTLTALKSKIKDKLKDLKPGDFLFAKGWDKNLFKDQSIFKRETLDKISTGNPIAIFSKDQHTFWVNSMVLEMLKIDKKSKDFSSEMIEVDPVTKMPNGIIREDATEAVRDLIKKTKRGKFKILFEKATKIAHQNGLVGIHDLGGEDAFEHYQSFFSWGLLKLRVYVTIPQKNLDSAVDLGIKTGFGNEFLKVGGVKLYADGALGSQTALTFDSYLGSKKNFGIEVTSEDDLTSLVKKANDFGISAIIHAIGDRAVHQALNALEKSGKGFLRNRIEHIQLIKQEDIKRFSELKIIASVQPIHATSDRDIAERYWGKRCRLAYPYNTLKENGAKLIFGSDMPIEDFSPLRGIHAAVTREREKDKRDPWYPEQRLSVEDSVYAYTLGAAYASGEEKTKGSIEIGKLADLVVLSQDIFEIPPEEILSTRVLATIFDGEIVFGKENIS
jgi:predicted amidohydrolase YtcJ